MLANKLCDLSNELVVTDGKVIKFWPRGSNHNETLVHDRSKAKDLKVKSNVKAGALRDGLTTNHNEILARDQAKKKTLKVKT